jgi:transposase
MNNERAAALYEKRKNAVEAVQRGEPVNLVARTHHVPLRTIFGWLARYRQGGWHALQEGRRSGRPRKVSGELMQWLYAAITLGDPRQYQLAFCLWSLAIVRLVLKKEHGVELSKSAVCRLLQQMGLTPQRPIYRSYRALRKCWHLDECVAGIFQLEEGSNQPALLLDGAHDV